MSEELLKRTKDVIIGSRLAGSAISRRTVIAIGTGAVKVNGSGYYDIDILCFRTTTLVPSVFKYLYVVNKYTDYRNLNIISGATKIFADL